jgi:hypothetical protein
VLLCCSLICIAWTCKVMVGDHTCCFMLVHHRISTQASRLAHTATDTVCHFALMCALLLGD